MKFATWNIRNLYRVGSLMTDSKDLPKCVRFSGSAGGQIPTQTLASMYGSYGS
jgi:hypothetical protein